MQMAVNVFCFNIGKIKVCEPLLKVSTIRGKNLNVAIISNI
jgi:hypothetical protein